MIRNDGDLEDGEVSEWFMVLVLKTSVSKMTEGSNPSLSDLIHAPVHSGREFQA